MNETPQSNIELEKEERAMEGRSITGDGKDLGDRAFHEHGWGTTPEAAKADLERMAAAEIDLAIQQAEAFTVTDPAVGAEAFDGLTRLYPSDPRKNEWSRRADGLRNEKK